MRSEDPAGAQDQVTGRGTLQGGLAIALAATVGAQRRSGVVFAVGRCLGSVKDIVGCLLYTSPSPRDRTRSRMPSSA
mgnify:CR=1 FL=1